MRRSPSKKSPKLIKRTLEGFCVSRMVNSEVPYVHAVYEAIYANGEVRLLRGETIYAIENPELWDRLAAILALLSPVERACLKVDGEEP